MRILSLLLIGVFLLTGCEKDPAPVEVTTIGSPQLLSPVNDTTLLEAPSLKWVQVSEASHYLVQVSSNASFASITDSATVTPTLFRPTQADTGVKYYWRVKALKGKSESAWSETRSYTIISPPNPDGGFDLRPGMILTYLHSISTIYDTVKLTIIGMGLQKFGKDNVTQVQLDNSFQKGEGGPEYLNYEANGDVSIWTGHIWVTIPYGSKQIVSHQDTIEKNASSTTVDFYTNRVIGGAGVVINGKLYESVTADVYAERKETFASSGSSKTRRTQTMKYDYSKALGYWTKIYVEGNSDPGGFFGGYIYLIGIE
jgi:hypothetical protein